MGKLVFGVLSLVGIGFLLTAKKDSGTSSTGGTEEKVQRVSGEDPAGKSSGKEKKYTSTPKATSDGNKIPSSWTWDPINKIWWK